MNNKILTPEEKLRSIQDSISRAKQKMENGNKIHNSLYALSGYYSCLAQLHLEYNRDYILFKRYTKESWEYYEKLLYEKDVSEFILKILYWETNCGVVMQLLSAGLIDESISYGKILWEAAERSQDFASIFMELMTKTFLPLLLEQDKEIFFTSIEKFYEYCNKPKGMKYFIGFVKMMDGVFQKNGKLIEEGLQDIIKFKGSIKRSDFDSIRNNVHCLWAIGLANLAISREIQFTMLDDPYLPKELLIAYSKGASSG